MINSYEEIKCNIICYCEEACMGKKENNEINIIPSFRDSIFRRDSNWML